MQSIDSMRAGVQRAIKSDVPAAVRTVHEATFPCMRALAYPRYFIPWLRQQQLNPKTARRDHSVPVLGCYLRGSIPRIRAATSPSTKRSVPPPA